MSDASSIGAPPSKESGAPTLPPKESPASSPSSEKAKGPHWNEQASEKIAWLKRVDLPNEFQLSTRTRVLNAETFRAALLVEAAKGPLGPRARMGTLQMDINRVWEMFKDRPPKTTRRIERLDDDLEIEVVDKVGD